MSNRFGNIFSFTTWGESHGEAIGCVVDGCPSMIDLCESDIQKYLDSPPSYEKGIKYPVTPEEFYHDLFKSYF